MILILISWIYILFSSINIGFYTNQLLKLNNKNFVINVILGLFTTTILASIWACFYRINIEFHVFLLLLNITITIKFKDKIIDHYLNFIKNIKNLAPNLQLYLIIILVLTIAQSASIPYVIDNESYYIQTIKWINEYGFVKGLVNLHFFLGQTSGWHITQSVFNFSFLYSNFNDLSGFCLLLGNVFAIEKLHEYYVNKSKIYLVIGLFPLLNIFFFQFISAPSPDIPVYVLSFVLFFYFIENFKNCNTENFTLITILVLYILYIKNTPLSLIFVPIILFFNNYKLLSRNLAQPFLISFLILSLFIAKNMIICGSPLFPSKLSDFTTLEYAIPDKIESFYYDQLKYYGYFITFEQYQSMNWWQLFLQWLQLPKLNGLFNKIIFLLVLICPIFIYKFKNLKTVWFIYLLMLTQIVILFLTSPQYRFFLNYVFFFLLFCFSCILFKQKYIQILLFGSLFSVAIVLFVPIDLNRFSNYKFMTEISNFSFKNIVFPYKNSKFKTGFEKIKDGNFQYNSPVENTFFWGSGDGKLPCVNKKQIAYFEKYFNIKPQLRTKNLKDGFYAKKVRLNEP